MRIRATKTQQRNGLSWETLDEFDRARKHINHLYARQEGVDYPHVYYLSTRRVRKILRAAGIGWEQA